MKKLLVIVLTISSSLAMGQLPAWNITSSGASAAMEAPLVAWNWPAEPLMMDAVKKFSREYAKRNIYYAPTVADGGRVARGEVTALRRRSQDLLRKNTALGPIYPYRKRDNARRLNTIDSLLLNVEQQFANLTITRTGIYGERMNLNQNNAMTMEQWSRKLDEIESDINNCRILNLWVK